MSSEKLLTICNYLQHLKMFYVNSEKMSNNPVNVQLAPFIKEGLKWADKYYHCMGDTKVYLIAMGKHVRTRKCMFVFLISSHCLVLNPNE